MATMTTQIGPVGARQVNQNFYVGQSDLTTIQKAVTAAAIIGSGCVVIPAGYAGSDAITAITGGNAAVYISDQRTPQQQNYVWSGSGYIPADFVQAKGYVTTGMPAVPQGAAVLGFDPTGTSGVGTTRLDFGANPGMGMPSLNITGQPSDGTPSWVFARFQYSIGNYPVPGIPQIEMPSQLTLINRNFDSYNLWTGDALIPGSQGMSIWARGTEDAIDLQGETLGGAYDQTIRLNYLGGNVQIGPITFDAAGNIVGIGNLTISGDFDAATVTANDADFDTCEVASSPVRTFANTPDGPGQGMVWPPDGIPVSLGDHWQSPSIDPTSLATYPAAGIAVSTGAAWGTPIAAASLATWPAAGVPVSAGNAWGTSIAAASLATWPAAGVPVSTGTAWGTSINPATLAHFPAAGIAVSTGSAWGTPIATTSLATWPATGIPVSTGTAWGTSIAAANVALLNQANVFTQATTTGPLTVNGAVIAAGNLFANVSAGLITAGLGNGDTTGTASGPAGLVARLVLSVRGQYGTSYSGQFMFNTWPSNTADSNDTMDIRHLPGGGSPVGGSGSLWSITRAGNMTVLGTITASAKSFLIPHPLDETKNLVHGSIEGPEFAVLYRGEGVTTGGWAEITLPDYFEALVQETDRTVLLTALFEDDAEQIGMLAASRVKDGKFKVWSALGAQKFYWEVKAVRGDIEALDVEPLKPEPINFQMSEEEPK